MERLHEGCDSDLAPDFLNFGAGVFFFNASKSFFFRFGAGIRFWSFNFWHRARSSIVLCKSVSADRTVMAASRILAAAAGCVIPLPLSFAAGSRESYWSGCMKVAIVIWHQIFSILVLVFFLKCFKIVLFSLWRRARVLELQFLLSLCTRKLLCVKIFVV